MPIHAIACIRQVPDYEAPAELFTVEGPPPRIVAAREVKAVIGLFDNHALEAALRLKDAHGGSVTAVTLGPPGAAEVLKRALHMGADAAVLLDEGPYGELDAVATAAVLAAGLRKLQPFDLVLCGRQASDWDGGVVGAGLAERLGLPLASLVRALEVRDGEARVERLIDEGAEEAALRLPCVLTVTNELNTPRLTSVQHILAAAKKKIQTWTPADLGLDPAAVRGAARTRIVGLAKPVVERRCEIIGGEDPAEAGANLALALRTQKVL
jgi:electron transfer flavoprotein beta subunit